MTDEQRQQLIRDLNAVANAPRYGGACSVCKEAAEEIERLTTRIESLETVAGELRKQIEHWDRDYGARAADRR
jgi:uncharacterized protein Yka (UPF0111/DUF47 family)